MLASHSGRVRFGNADYNVLPKLEISSLNKSTTAHIPIKALPINRIIDVQIYKSNDLIN